MSKNAAMKKTFQKNNVFRLLVIISTFTLLNIYYHEQNLCLPSDRISRYHAAALPNKLFLLMYPYYSLLSSFFFSYFLTTVPIPRLTPLPNPI